MHRLLLISCYYAYLLDHGVSFYYGSESAKEILSKKRSIKKLPEWQIIEETLKENIMKKEERNS